ncbi:MAG: ABC transporter substrate-binding protein, partial [Acetobacteraceae bacterium]|nr:ABC transporter substrate-binding protein [Acetobacteraceae bacterium]
AFLHPVAPHYSTMLKFDTANYTQIVGDLAQSWSISPDRRTYTFKLHPGILFHDGTKLTSADVKASYQRIIAPPPGVVSSRQVDYASIASIETPDPLTVVFHLQWPDASMLANFASPWNCIYSAVKLAEDPQFPKTHVLGSGPFVFIRHDSGKRWIGKRWDGYFLPGKPYLDAYEADFISGSAVVKALETGRVMAEFRSITPEERDELTHAMGERISLYESPWIIDLLLVLNTQQPPFNDVRVRRAISLAIDRWGMAQSLSSSTFLKYAGGLMRPGSAFSIPEAELIELPGFSHDIAASRAEARRLLAEAGVPKLSFTLTNRDIPVPYGPAAEAVIAAWREIGVSVTQQKLNTKDWQSALESGHFAAAFDFSGDYFDDPTLQLTKYVSRDLSPVNYGRSTDRVLDALYVGQAITPNLPQRTKVVREFERRALEQAYTVPILWWDRIVVTESNVRGWNMTPSHYIGQDLTDVWLEH